MRRLWITLLLLLPGPLFAAADPVVSATGPDALLYGALQNYPIGGRGAPAQMAMVGTYSHYDRIWPFHRVAKAASPAELRRASEEIAPTYPFRGATHTLGDYLAHNPVTGLLIARDDTILFEHYQYGRTDQDRLLSQSMAKTIVAMLIGVAIGEGRIRSVDDLAQTYVPALAGTAFGQTSLRALLHMASGVAFREDYTDPSADNAKLSRVLFGQSGYDTAHAVAMFDTREALPDTHFNYGGVQTEVLGLVLTHAVGMSPAAYLQSRIWQPMGAEADATWTVDHSGQEVAYCCFSAVLRDWARLGLLLAHDGAIGGHQIIPRQWLLDATTAPPDSPFSPRRATPSMGYGYQVWLFPGSRRQFSLLGIHGQSIYVDPGARLVMVQTAVRVSAAGERAEANALWDALVARYGAGADAASAR
ncbi:MAG: serine hydrolase [Acetobacteraceae bacterium]|jgi:CubicO group peptidase (beta-lactamase class C family)